MSGITNATKPVGFYVAHVDAPCAAPGCVCGRRGHKTLGRSLAACLAQAGPDGGCFYAPVDGGDPRALTSMELAALPTRRPTRGRPKTGRGVEGERIVARATAEEKQHAEAQAKRAGMPLADYVRVLLGLTPLRPPAVRPYARTTTHGQQGTGHQAPSTTHVPPPPGIARARGRR